VLSEEAVLLFGVLVALALLVLGVLELLAPSHPRQPRRVGRDPWRRARSASTPPRPVRTVVPAPPRPADEVEPPIEKLLRSEAEGFRTRIPAAPAGTWPPKIGRPQSIPPPVDLTPPAPVTPPYEARVRPEWGATHEPEVAREPEVAYEPEPEVEPAVAFEPDSAVGPPSYVEDEPTRAADASEPEPEPWEPAAPRDVEESEPVAISAAEPPAAPESAVERCYALYEAKRFRDVVAEAMAALETPDESGVADEPEGVARLWGVIGLAQQAMGEANAAYVAFGEAIAASAVPERQTWERYQAALALEVGRDLVARAESAGLSDGEERVAELRTAMSWLERGVAVAPSDHALRDCLLAAREALWPTYEHVVMDLIQRQDYDVARRLLQEAVESPECPIDFQPAFRELLSATYVGEVGQLTAEALRRMREGKESEALGTLERAEAMLVEIPDESVPERRRQELERRLWWSYTKVGIRWMEGGMNEQALPPLLHALRFGSVGPQRLDETRRALARALEGLVEARAPLVERLMEGKSREEARTLIDPLWASIEEALAQGMSADELGEAFTRVSDLRERLSV
jgi:tetratricopeptide (TPR) repeat protein